MEFSEVEVDKPSKPHFGKRFLRFFIIIVIVLLIFNAFNPALYLYGTKTIEVETINYPNTWSFVAFILYKIALALLLAYFTGIFLLLL